MIFFAEKFPHIKFSVFDINEDKVKSWNNEDLLKSPVSETGLDTALKSCRARNLFFSTKLRKNIA